MTYASVMVYGGDDIAAATRVALAAEIAVHFDARVIGTMASPAEAPIVDTYTGGAMLGETRTLFRDIAEADLGRAEAAFWKGAGAQVDRFEWRGRIGLPSDVAGHALRAADLVVVGRRDADALSPHALDPADLLMIAGRPLLVSPPSPSRSPLGNPAVVAWTDSREAQRAVQVALPILKAASRVHVIEISAEAGLEDAQGRVADVADYLGRHGIIADGRAIRGNGSARSAQIIEFVEDCGAGLIVAGGYGHARMREWVMGGVTHGLLAGSPVCLFVSH